MAYVYFFRETGRKFVKIGCSGNSYLDRFSQFKMYAPLGAYVVGFIETDLCFKLEKTIHKKYNHRRLSGEFFDFTDEECYNIINKYDTSFGQILDFTNRLIKTHGFSKESLYKALKSKIASYEYDEKVIDPDTVKLINSLKGKEMTNTEIANFLAEKGVVINSLNLGLLLSNLGYKNKNKRVDGTVKRIYTL